MSQQALIYYNGLQSTVLYYTITMKPKPLPQDPPSHYFKVLEVHGTGVLKKAVVQGA